MEERGWWEAEQRSRCDTLKAGLGLSRMREQPGASIEMGRDPILALNLGEIRRHEGLRCGSGVGGRSLAGGVVGKLDFRSRHGRMGRRRFAGRVDGQR